MFQVAVALLHKYQELKGLGHPDFQSFDKSFRSTPTNDALQSEVCLLATDNVGAYHAHKGCNGVE